MAFLARATSQYEVNHRNGVKTDNRALNLEWVTPEENLLHAARVLGITDCFVPKLSGVQRQVIRIRLACGECTTDLAVEFGVSNRTIGRCRQAWSDQHRRVRTCPTRS